MVNWLSVALWVGLALLGALRWIGERELGRVEQRVEQVERLLDVDHDDLVRLREVVPRVEAALEEVKRQNAEILRRLDERGR